MLENVKIKNRKYIKMDAFQIVLYTIVTLYCISMLYVLLFGFVNSLKDATDYEWNNPFAFPSSEFGWKLSNYTKVFKDFNVFTVGGKQVYLPAMFLNSVL